MNQLLTKSNLLLFSNSSQKANRTEDIFRQMGSETSSTPKLSLFSIPPAMQSPERPGMLTPPLYASVAVPFRWEEEPGKPRPCTALATISRPTDITPKCLELPPRLLSDTKLPSPTTVLEGPYVSRSRFQSSSFRIGKECYGSFSPESQRGRLGAVVLSKRGTKERGWFGSWRRRVVKGNKDGGGSSYVFPSSLDRDNGDGGGNVGETTTGKVKMTRIRRAGSFSSITYPRSSSSFWETIYEGLKHAVPWKSRKLKKNGF